MILLLIVSILVWLVPRVLHTPFPLLVIVYFSVVAIIDLEHRVVMHPTSLVGAMIALGTGIYLRGSTPFYKALPHR